MIADDSQQTKQLQTFEQELMPFVDALHNFAYQLCRNREDASDLVQDTYMKAFKAIDSYQTGTNAKAWLFQILKNNFINLYRKRAVRPTAVSYDDALSPYKEGKAVPRASRADLRAEIFGSMMGDEVTKAIACLSRDFREVLILCDVEGFTYEEIADIVNIKIGTVRSRLHRARKLLQQELREYAAAQGFNTNLK